ncbi:hypothetical protein DMC64_42030 [Amycolatopsis sp. WAC 04197]|uniref:hypothetical protein n=1 Tax=Amycolatopsis sp. WAC 04197 TaxID=2203199 RepID=UPI000F78F971|nr:hypothetical protein [Amycolatopsis sp. WAC 04197]RSN38647.1 hypothetical protein DMC64_42030 [Amycolatopsis sp. WAC 04197]
MQGLAAAADVALTTVKYQYLAGLLPGRRVGDRLTVFRESTLNRLRNNPQPSKPRKDGRIPELVTTAWVAERWERSTTAIDRLYRRGKLPGVQLGGFVLFRRELIDSLAVEELTPGPHHEQIGAGEPVEDEKLAGLLTREEAAGVLGINVQEVKTWFHYGRIPGATPTSTASAQRKLLVFRESTLLQRGTEDLHAPADDGRLPTLVTGTQAAEILGVNPRSVAAMHERGELPGRPVIDGGGDTRRSVYRREVVERLAGS